MKRISFCLLLAAACGCASFHSGPYIVRGQFETDIKCSKAAPFSRIDISWRQFPMVLLGDTLDDAPGKKAPQAVPVSGADMAYAQNKASSIFKESGLYDTEKGTGTVKIGLVSYNRWTYNQAIRGIFVETPFIFIWPSSVKVIHKMRVEAVINGKAVKFEKEASVKTIFHLLLLPLFPFTTHGMQEHVAIQQLLRYAAHEIHRQSASGATCAQ